MKKKYCSLELYIYQHFHFSPCDIYLSFSHFFCKKEGKKKELARIKFPSAALRAAVLLQNLISDGANGKELFIDWL